MCEVTYNIYNTKLPLAGISIPFILLSNFLEFEDASRVKKVSESGKKEVFANF